MGFGVEGIAAASMSLSAAKVQNQVGISMMKKTMETQEQQATQLIEQMMQSVSTSGQVLDVMA